MVLVIDDDLSLAPLVRGLLSAGGEGGLDVTEAHSLAEGLQLLRDADHCVVLLDLRLPDSDGLQSLEACRANCRSDTPIVVLTAEGDRALAVAALREGADDFLLKTELTPSSIARVIRYAIERSGYREALKAVEARARVVVESIDSMIGVVDERGRLLEVNRTWRQFAERSKCPVMTVEPGVDFFVHCRNSAHPFGLSLVHEASELLASGRERFEAMWEGTASCGAHVALRLRGAIIDLPIGRGVAFVIDDLSEKRRIERELAAYTERLALAVEAGHVGAWDWNMRTGLVVGTPWLYRIYGSDDRVLRTAEDYIASMPAEDAAAARVELDRARRDHNNYVMTHRIIRPDGSVRLVEAEGRFFYDERGEAVRMCGALVDVTEERLASARQSLSQRLEALGELSAGVSHDLKNTLTLAHAALATLEAAKGLDDAARTAVADLRLATNQAAQLAGSLLAFAQPQSQAGPSVVDLNEVCLGFVAFLRRLLPRTLRIAAECGREPALVRVPAVSVQQVVMNLVLNARNAIEAARGGDGEVRIRVTPSRLSAGETTHLLEVADNGPGIPANSLDRLFEPFVSLGPTGAVPGAVPGLATGRGTGLGLAIVKTILETTGGTVRILSEAGRGATFQIRWPAADPEPVRVEAKSLARASLEAKTRQTIAVIQKGEYARRILADGLGEAGFAIFEAASLDAVATAVERGDLQPAVIVMDDALLEAGEPAGVDAGRHAAGGAGDRAAAVHADTNGQSPAGRAEDRRRHGIERLRRVGSRAPVILITGEECADGALESDDFLAIAQPVSVGQVCAAVRAVLEEDDDCPDDPLQS